MMDKQDQDEYEDVVCSGKEEANRLACSYSKIQQLIEQYIAWKTTERKEGYQQTKSE